MKLSGSVQGVVNTSQIAELKIPVFKNVDYDKVVLIIDSLNQKITLNNSICSDLESMAKLLYDYWFVQFDFPDENGRPYKSGGGKMVWNDEVKREIPEGWGILDLNEHLKTIRGISYSTPDLNDNEHVTVQEDETNVTLPVHEDVTPGQRAAMLPDADEEDEDEKCTCLHQCAESVYFHRLSRSGSRNDW